MSVASLGRFRHGTSGCSHGKRNSGTRSDVEHDIYAAYSEEDQSDVLRILDILKRNQLSVYDPHLDALPTQTIFKAWLEQGIHMSKITVIFLTKRFISHTYCRYQADNAVVRYAKTKGRHRIIVVMLQSCKIPKNLHHFNCVYAWKFRENPEEQYSRILKAIFSPRDKFRRGSLLWTNVSRNTSRIANKRINELSVLKQSVKQEKSLLNYANLVFNLSKIKLALENCELKCTSENCGFRCSGDKIIDKFFAHIKICKYQQVRCRFCRQTTLRKNLDRHEQSTCKRRHIKCPNECCGKKLAAAEMFNHARLCSYKIVVCPNEVYGCNGVFARKDQTKHLEICDYEKITCKHCNTLIFRIDEETHKCEKCEVHDCDCISDDLLRPDEKFKCNNGGCEFTNGMHELQSHKLICEFRRVQCPDCGMRLAHKDLIWHQKNCDKIIECELCHQFIPSSSKFTHDRWICNGKNIQILCEICHKCVKNGRKETHLRSCICDHRDLQTGTNAVSSTRTTSSCPVYTNNNVGTCPILEGKSSCNSTGFSSLRMTGQAQRTTGLSPTFERLLIDVMPSDTSQWRERSGRERSYSEGSDNFVNSHLSASLSKRTHVWTPSLRNQWRALMQQIDKNESGLRMAMSNR